MKILRFYALDGLRGIFSLTVLLNHAVQSVTGWSNEGPFRGPHLSVVYFFIISGFVLSHSHNKDNNILKYALYRFARLWPLTVIAMFAMVTIFFINKINGGYYPGDYVFHWKTWLANVSFLRGMTPHYIELINEPSWSIGIEFWVSLLIPVLFLKIGKYARIAGAVGIFCVLAYSSSAGIISTNLNNMFSLMTAIAAMLIGSGLYTISQSSAFNVSSRPKLWGVLAGISIAACLYGTYGQPFAKNRLDYLYIAAFIPLIFVDYMKDENLVKKFLYSKPVQFLGYISFPLYLLHFSVMITGITAGDPFWGVVKMTVASIIVAYLYATIIDVKMYRYLKGRINALLPDKSPEIEKSKES